MIAGIPVAAAALVGGLVVFAILVAASTTFVEKRLDEAARMGGDLSDDERRHEKARDPRTPVNRVQL